MFGSNNRLVVLVMALATPTAVLVSTGPASAATTTYVSTARVPIGQTTELGDGSGMIAINDASTTAVGKALPYPSTAPINGLEGKVSKVVLRLNDFSHQWPTDVDMMLVAPTGERAMVMSDQGGLGAVSGVDLIFDDTSTNKLDWGTPFSDGTYRPSDNGAGTDLGDNFPAPAPAPPPVAYSEGFSAFDGVVPNGDWSLYVTDDLASKVGSIFSWSITVTSTGSDNYPSRIDVAAAPGAVTDVNVRLDDLSHGYPEDVDLLLVGPQGQQATILSDIPQTGGIEDVDLTFDDAAPSAVSKPIISGTFRPTNLGTGPDAFPAPAPTATGSSALAVFNGTDPNGTWKLYAADDQNGRHGGILGWSLDIATTGSPTPTPTGSPSPTQAPTGADTVHPRVSSTAPAQAATGVGRGASVKAKLSEAVRPGTVTRSTAYLVRKGTTRHVRATVTWKSDTRRIVINPGKKLRPDTTYQVVITTAVRDPAGNRLDQNPTEPGPQKKTWRFTTR